MFIVSRVLILTLMIGRGSDLGVHRGYAGRVLAGQMPFRDFTPEYPPLALAFALLPAAIDPSLHGYFPLFRGLCCLVDAGTWILLLRMTRGRPGAGALYLLCTTVLGPLLYDRIDLALGGILLLAAWNLHAGRPRGLVWWIGVGIAFKLVPIVLAPAVLAARWKRSRWGPGSMAN